MKAVIVKPSGRHPAEPAVELVAGRDQHDGFPAARAHPFAEGKRGRHHRRAAVHDGFVVGVVDGDVGVSGHRVPVPRHTRFRRRAVALPHPDHCERLDIDRASPKRIVAGEAMQVPLDPHRVVRGRVRDHDRRSHCRAGRGHGTARFAHTCQARMGPPSLRGAWGLWAAGAVHSRSVWPDTLWTRGSSTQVSPKMSSAPFSPIIMAGALVLPEVNVGMIEASTTRRNSMPRTLSSASTTAIGSGPILQVPTG